MAETTLAKNYDPKQVEAEVWQRWEDADAFHAEPDPDRKPYVVVIPPPNVTAALHLGHALNNTLQDVLVRWRRMCGDNAVWLPGTDHAGIATQTVVDKRLKAEGEPSLVDYKKLEAEGEGGREKFVEKVQAWKDEYEATITNQLKKMGCSCDWQRQAFTMDEPRAKAVREAFFQLFRDGLIYRGKRLVNWDPATQTALADDEVEMHEIDGHFWYLKYPVVDDEHNETGDYVTVATTRPETMLGDTAVAVNPGDADRARFIGQSVRLPIVNRIIPVLGDDYVVPPDPESDDPMKKYASGFLKVTPAHDPNDYEIGQRHGLAMINVMAPDGSISDQHGWPAEDFARGGEDLQNLLGLDRYEAREAIVDWFRTNDLLAEVRPYRHTVGHSYRSHVAVEPYLSDQWYVKVTDDRLAGAALKAMAPNQRSGPLDGEAGGELRFVPERYARTFETWHENIRDWCISRQLWWGHRIPVWSKEGEHEIDAEPHAACRLANGRTFVCLREDDEQFVAELESQGFERDPDVLDTWFSSALWPLSTLGWPDETDELQHWNPTSTLSTAREIITLWVSRMVMFNLYFRGCVPFFDVFIHAMIQDGEGRKMSKSLGNGVDPLDIIHSHGADAMRYTLASMTTHTQDVRMPVETDAETGRNTSPKFDQGRNFCNKLWNAGRFALEHLSQARSPRSQNVGFTLADRWIVSRFVRTVNEVDAALENYQFASYAQLLYDFFWRDLCDWYLEAIKPVVRGDDAAGAAARATLAMCLDGALRMMHPVVPFVTEKLWAELNRVAPERDEMEGVLLPASATCINARWPIASEAVIDERAERQFELARTAIGEVRNIRAQYNVPPRQSVPVRIEAAGVVAEALEAGRGLIQTLAMAEVRAIEASIERPDDAAVSTAGEITVMVEGLIDAGAERERLTRRKADLEKSRNALSGRLANPGYTEKAPAHLVEQTRQQLAETEKELEAVEASLARLAG